MSEKSRRVTAKPLTPLPYSDLTNAEALLRWSRDDLRYCYHFKKWFVWDGHRWQLDQGAVVMRHAKATIKRLAAKLKTLEDDDEIKRLLSHIKVSLSAPRLFAMITLAQSELGVPVKPTDFDADSWKLNCRNGILDLTTGKLHPHTRSDLCSKIVPVAYDPSALCPTWDAFLHTIMAGNTELIAFLQRAIGYALTGNTSEQCLFLLYGTGANGKSTFLETSLAMLGDYGRQAEFSTFILKRSDDAPRNDIAALHGARFVSAIEVAEGKRLAEPIIKSMTGQDTVTCRRLFEEFFSYQPAFKVFLGANHRPVIKGTDHGIWRRIRLIPFKVTIPDHKQDKELLAKLRQELPGILAWAVRGCLAWQQHGLGMPPEVQEATANYRRDMDTLGDFLSECCVMGDQFQSTSKALYEAYKAWGELNGEQIETQKAFGTKLAERGFTSIRIGARQARGWRGLGLMADPAPDRSDGYRRDISSPSPSVSPHEQMSKDASDVSAPVSPLSDHPQLWKEYDNDSPPCPRCGRRDITWTALRYHCPACGPFEPKLSITG